MRPKPSPDCFLLLVFLVLTLWCQLHHEVAQAATFEVSIISNSDDAEEESGGSLSTGNSKIELGKKLWGGFRFQNVTVPQGATITSAYVRFRAEGSNSNDTDLTVFGHDVDSAVTFSSSNKISTRTRTSASISWQNVENWSSGSYYQSPELKTVVQEIVDRSGWASGNSMAILIRSDNSGGERLAWARDGDSSSDAVIHIEFATAPTEYFVRTDGSNSNSGTGADTSQAWQTIDYAVSNSAVDPGDIIYVMTGTYNELVTPARSGTSSQPIQLIADTDGSIFGGTGGAVTIQAPADQHAVDFGGDNYWEITGFVLSGVAGNDTLDVDNSTGVVVKRCEIHSGLHGVEVDNSSSAELINCLIRDNAGEGIYLINGTLQVVNCTVVNSASDGIEQDTGTLTVINTIIANNSFSGLDINGGTTSHTYNLLFGNNAPYEGTSAGTGEIGQDPQFTGGYQLSSGSPAIDAGTSSNAPDVDLLGESRPQDGGHDIGAYEYVPPTANLRGHWRLDETTGTNASDSSGNANDGMLTGGVTFDADGVSPGARRNALEFNGADDYIQISDDSTLRPTSALTIAAFVKGDAWGSGSFANVVLRKGEGNPNNYQLAIADGQVAFYLDDNDGGGIRGDTVLETDRWYHVAATWDGTTVRIYINGELDMTPVAYSGPIGTDTRSLYIGGRSGTDYFDGCLDDVRLYGAALSQSEIMDLYGLTVHYKFDEASGTVAADSSYHNLDANLQGTAGWTDGRLDGAIDFDGSSDAAISGTFTPPEDGTVLLWMQVPGTPAARGRLFGIHDAFEIRHETTGHLEFDLNIGTGGTFSTTVPVDTADTWYHIAATFDSSTDEFQVFINGELDTSGTVTLSQQSGGVLSIGNRTGATDYFLGALDDLRIFDRVLPLDEIGEIHASGLPKGLRIIKWVEVK